MKIVRVAGSEGAGVSALLVHGNDLCAEFYLPLAEMLAARGVQMSLVTLPGFHDQAPYEEPTWGRFAADIAAAVDQLPGERRVLIGHSMGGFMAMLAAARLGERLDRLVLIEPAIYPRRFMAKTGSKTYLRRVVLADRTRFSNSTGFMPRVHDLDRYPADKIALYLEVRQSSDVDTIKSLFTELPNLYPLPFAEVVAPTLLVSGANIGLRGRMLASMVRRRFANIAHRRIAGAAHWVVNERDAELTEHIVEFVC